MWLNVWAEAYPDDSQLERWRWRLQRNKGWFRRPK